MNYARVLVALITTTGLLPAGCASLPSTAREGKASARIVSEADVFRYYDRLVTGFRAGRADDIVSAWDVGYTNYFGRADAAGDPQRDGAALFRKQAAWKGRSTNGPADVFVTSIRTTGHAIVVNGHIDGSWRMVQSDGTLSDGGVSFENDFVDTWTRKGNAWFLHMTTNGKYRELNDSETAKLKEKHAALRKHYGK